MKDSLGAWRVVAAQLRRLRYGWLVLALCGGAGIGLIVGSVALGDEVCGTAGDLPFCAQWGVNGFAYRLSVKNTGTQTISSFAFTLPNGTTANGTAGNAGCTANSSTNQVTCTNPTAPGQTQFVDITSQTGVPVGSSGTLTLKDANGAAQPDQTVSLQSSAKCSLIRPEGSATDTCTTSSTGTTETTTPPCTPTLKVLKDVQPAISQGPNPHFPLANVKQLPPGSHSYTVGYDPRYSFGTYSEFDFVIYVTNASNPPCDAANVIVSDQLSNAFYSLGEQTQLFGPPATVHHVPGSDGYGGNIAISIPSLPTGATLTYEFGVSAYPQGESNTAKVGRAESTVYVRPVPEPGAKVTQAGNTSVQGTAEAGGSSVLDRVRVAIQSFFSGARDAAAHCAWLSNSYAALASRACNQPIWLTVTGTKHWRLSLKRALKPGRYEVFAEALGKYGLSGDTFAKGRGDTKTFTVR